LRTIRGSTADAVLFGFGPSRRRDPAMRHHLRRWQPQLRSLFVMRIESFKYRLRVSGYELPEVGRTPHHAYDDRFAAVLGALPHTPSAAFRLGGAQSLHTNSRDEALGLPAEESVRIALRTQRIIAYETRVTNTTDPVGGSEYIENLTDGRWPQLCRAGSLRAEGEQQVHLDAFIVLFRDIDDLITSLLEQIAATDVF